MERLSAPRAPETSAPARDGAQVVLRRVLLALVAAAALTAVLGGLARVGLDVLFGLRVIREHGPLFVLGVFGTVISLERAVALGPAWALFAPLLGACAAIAIVAGAPGAAWLAVAAGAALVALNAAIVRRQSAPHTWLMLVGSALLCAGEILWALGRPVFQVVATWIGFFVLTIVAERLELSRLAPTPRWATRALVALAITLAAAAVATALGATMAPQALGATMVLLAGWQLRFDLARRTLRQRGLPRFVAAGVLLGAAWLLVAGLFLAWNGLPPGGPLYDATLHCAFVGFVVSMVFAHAPIILPAVARVQVPFSVALYVPLVVLHAALAVRVAGGLAESAPLRQIGSGGNALALVLYALAVLYARSRARRADSRVAAEESRNAGADQK